VIIWGLNAMKGGLPRVTSRGVVFDDDHVNLVVMF
jgi:hypothetical protein